MAIDATEAQSKFEFYVVALTFTLLAASIQTADFTRPLIPNLLELLAWLGFAVAGLAGLSRLQWMPQSYKVLAVQAQFEERRNALLTARAQGERRIHITSTQSDADIEEMIANSEASIEVAKSAFTKLERRVKKRFIVTKSAFLVGLGAVVLSRAYPVLAAIAREACCLTSRCS